MVMMKIYREQTAFSEKSCNFKLNLKLRSHGVSAGERSHGKALETSRSIFLVSKVFLLCFGLGVDPLPLPSEKEGRGHKRSDPLPSWDHEKQGNGRK